MSFKKAKRNLEEVKLIIESLEEYDNEEYSPYELGFLMGYNNT